MNNRLVAVIILNYKSWKETLQEARLCNSLLMIDYSDIIIVDNSSPNESFIRLKEASEMFGFVLLNASENRGYASGNNLGLRYAHDRKYEYAWILNNDIIIEDKLLVSKMMDVFKEDERIAVVNPDVYAPDGHMFNRDSKRPGIIDLTVGMINYRKKGRMITDLGGYGLVYRPQGCCMMVDLNKMHQVDYMDERTFLYVEEPILAERLLKEGFRCACCLTACIIHNHSHTVKSVFSKNNIREMQTKSFIYYLKEYRKFNKITIIICALFNYVKLVLTE